LQTVPANATFAVFSYDKKMEITPERFIILFFQKAQQTEKSFRL
jgi:hypothetical protein